MFKYILLLLYPFFAFGQMLDQEVAILLKAKEYTEAEIILTNYLTTHPNEAKALELLGETYALQENWEAATTVFETLVLKDSKNANYHFKYGGALGMKALRANKLYALFMMNEIKSEFLLAAKLDKTHIDSRWGIGGFLYRIARDYWWKY